MASCNDSNSDTSSARSCWLASLALLLVGGLALVFPGNFKPAQVEDGLADGFQFPVGDEKANGYYVFRGFKPNSHSGEDWNGISGGNSDLGDLVYSIGHGEVVLAEDAEKDLGNVIIIRHRYRDRSGAIKTIDSAYFHLDEINVTAGERVKRGQLIGTIGRGPNDMYMAHLHFEIRKNTKIALNIEGFPKDRTSYHDPRNFIRTHRQLKVSLSPSPSFLARMKGKVKSMVEKW